MCQNPILGSRPAQKPEATPQEREERKFRKSIAEQISAGCLAAEWLFAQASFLAKGPL
jgi:hypothetical protein